MKRFKEKFVERAEVFTNESLRNMLYVDEDEESPIKVRDIKFELLSDGSVAATSTQIMTEEYFEEVYLPIIGYESLDQVMEEQP